MPAVGRERASPWGHALAWTHALVFLSLGITFYARPEVVFGETAWLPLANLAVRMLAAALIALGAMLIGASRAGSCRAAKRALFAAVVLDVQMPILLALQPPALEYMWRTLGVPWFAAALFFCVLVGMTVHGLFALSSGSTSGAAAGSRG